MEELLKQILNRLDSMEDGQKLITKRLDSMENGQKLITNRLDGMEDGQKLITKLLDSMEIKQDRFSGQLSALQAEVSDMRAQQDENTAIIKALVHNVEIANAKIDGLALSTLSKDAAASFTTKADIAMIDAKLDILTIRQTTQEAHIRLLKQA